MAPLLFGYTLGYTSPGLLPMELSASKAVFTTSVTVGEGVVSSEAGLFGAVVNIGAMLGALLAGPLCDGIGRKHTIAVTALMWLGTWLWLASSRALWPILTARSLSGVAVGIASGTVPVYIAECAPPAIRGSLGALNQLGVVVGILLVYLLGYARQTIRTTNVACTYRAPQFGPQGCGRIADGWECSAEFGACIGAMADWVELCWGAAVVAALLLLGSLLLLPETPAYLRARGEHEQARATAAFLNTGEYDDDSGGGGDGAGGAPEPTVGLGGLCQKRSTRVALRVACGLCLAQQLSGINAVIFYSSDILLRGGLDDPNLGGLLIMGIQVVMTLVCTLLVDRAGRRPLLLSALSMMVVSSLTMAFFFHEHGKLPSWVAIIALVGYIAGFSIGLGAIPWLIMGEIFPTAVRATAASLATMLNWTTSLIVTLFFPSVSAALGPAAAFLGFTSFLLLSFVFVLTSVPETKGVPLEAISALLAGTSSPGKEMM